MTHKDVGFRRLPGPADTLPESPCWNGASRQLFWVDHSTSTLNSVQFPGLAYRAFPLATEGNLRFARLLSARVLLIGSERQIYRFDLGTLALQAMPGQPPLTSETCINDGAVGPDGAIVIAVSDRLETSPIGGFYAWVDDKWQCLRDKVVVANGPAFSPDGRSLFLSDTVGRQIWRLPPDKGASELFCDLSGRKGYPDGLFAGDMDELYVSYWEGGAVEVLDTKAQTLGQISVGPPNATCCCVFEDGGQRYLAVTACDAEDATGPSGIFLTSLQSTWGNQRVAYAV